MVNCIRLVLYMHLYIFSISKRVWFIPLFVCDTLPQRRSKRDQGNGGHDQRFQVVQVDRFSQYNNPTKENQYSNS